MGSTIVEYPVKILKDLLAYAHTFERCEDYREDMALSEPSSSSRNPFRQKGACHPVEKALIKAKAAAYENDISKLKKQRAIVLEYLEPQYQCIVSAAREMVEEIKQLKIDDG
jgi:hypothetical protein